MKIKYLFLLVVIALFSCTNDDVGFDTVEQDGDNSYTGYIPSDAVEGVAYIKLTEPGYRALSIKKTASGLSTSMSDFDKLNQEYSVSSMEPVFCVEGRFEARKRRAGLHLWYKVEFDKSTPLRVAFSGFDQLNTIDIVEPEIQVVRVGGPVQIRPMVGTATGIQREGGKVSGSRPTTVPFNDPRLFKQWHYNNTGSEVNSVEGADVNLFKAWEIATGLPEVIVAVIDEGVDYTHEDLAANMWVNTNTTDPSNPYRDGVHGWNFVNNTAVITGESHGTHVAGTVAAVNGNGIGVCGVAGGDGGPGTGARIMGVQISEAGVWGSNSDIAKGFEYAADNGAVIAQNSWGFTRSTELPSVLKTGIDYFIDHAGMDENGIQTGPMKGGLVVFAAGNSGDSNNIPVAPTAYERVICIGNMGPDFRMVFHSQHGSWITLIAPGGVTEKDAYTGISYVAANGVLSTVPGNLYAFMQGTSMSAPHVSGIAALAISHFGGASKPGFTPDILKEKIIKSARRVDSYSLPKYNRMMGVGNIDAYNVLSGEMPVITTPEPVVDLSADWSIRKTIKVEWSVTGDNVFGKAFAYDVLVSEKPLTDVDFDKLPLGVIFEHVRVGSAAIGDKLNIVINSVKVAQRYYIAISALNNDYGRSSGMMIDGVTNPGSKPDPVTDLKGSWSATSVDLSWSVTRDMDTGKPVYYNMLISKNDLTGVDFDDKPADATLYSAWVLDATIGSELTYTISGLESGQVYYVAITGVDSDKQRSNAMMIDNKSSITPPVVNPPTVVNPTMADIKLVGLNKSTTLDLKSYFSDDKGVANLTFTLESTPSDIAEMTISNGVANIVSKKYGTATVKVRATNAGGKSVDHPTGFKVICSESDTPPPPEGGEITLYPNPVESVMNISMNSSQTVEVSLYNAMGARVINKSVKVEPSVAGQLDLSKISGGAYTVVLKYGDKEVKERITKL